MARDNEDFTIIFNEVYPGLCRFLECFMGGQEGALAAHEDIAQESFMRFYRSGPAGLQSREARFWLYRVARNLALNEMSRRHVRSRLWSKVAEIFNRDGTNPAEEFEQEERKKMVLDLLQSLPEYQRAALLLREQSEMSYREIARVLDVSESKVKVDIFRARSALRSKWKEVESAVGNY